MCWGVQRLPAHIGIMFGVIYINSVAKVMDSDPESFYLCRNLLKQLELKC